MEDEVLNNEPLRVGGDSEPNNPFPDTTPEDIANAILDEIGLDVIPYSQYYKHCLTIYLNMGYDKANFDDVYAYIEPKAKITGNSNSDVCWDYFLPVNFNSGAIDYTPLNNIDTGIYKVVAGVEAFDTITHTHRTIIMQMGILTNNVSNTGRRIQTIIFTPLEPSAVGSPLKIHNRVSNVQGNWWDYDFQIPVTEIE